MSERLTYNERMVVAIRQAIEDIVNGGALSASISTGTGSKSYTRLDLPQLQELERHYIRLVKAERDKHRATTIGYRRTRPDFGRFG